MVYVYVCVCAFVCLRENWLGVFRAREEEEKVEEEEGERDRKRDRKRSSI